MTTPAPTPTPDLDALAEVFADVDARVAAEAAEAADSA
jgi:hypothetical protein